MVMPLLVLIALTVLRGAAALCRLTLVPRPLVAAVGTLRLGSVGSAPEILLCRGSAAVVGPVPGAAAGCSYTPAPMPRHGAVGTMAADQFACPRGVNSLTMRDPTAVLGPSDSRRLRTSGANQPMEAILW